MSTSRTSVLVLCGGPDAERDVSLVSGRGVADALRQTGRHDVHEQRIDRLTPEQLREMPGDVVFPVLHGPWGEGGGLQEVLERDGRPYIGCGPGAARRAMDKCLTKAAALAAGVPTAAWGVENAADEACPLPLPVVLKPVHEGSSVGLHLCRTAEEWARAKRAVGADRGGPRYRSYMVEALIAGREITAGVLDPGRTGPRLPLIEITPASGVYDYAAKYDRDDTRYEVGPSLGAEMTARIQEYAGRVAGALGVRHLCRVDFIVDVEGRPWMLEVNTMPGFTPHSLFPMAARGVGLEMPELCGALVEMALRDGRAPEQ